MFEDWAGEAIPKEDTASICFRNPEWNNEAEYINHTDEYAQQKNNAADTKLQNKEFDYEKAKNDLIIDYPKLNSGDKIKILPYKLQPNENREIWPEKWKNLCGCFVTIKEYDETENGYLINESDNCGWFPNEFDYSTLIKAENIQGNQTKVNPEYPRLFPGDKIMIKPFEQQKDGYTFGRNAKNMCGKIVTIKSFDETIRTYQLEEISLGWYSAEFDFNTLIRANTNCQDITNPTQEDFNNLQPGDMVLLKSITECNAGCWYWSARNCCRNWVTLQSRTNECMYFAIKEDSNDATYIKFEWISAIRKKV